MTELGNSKKVLALVMIVKNEKKRILVTLASVKGIVDKVIIMDTGSTDNTMEIIQEYCVANNMPLDMFQKVFPVPFHFANGRNAVIDYANDKADYLLLMDCNDELQNGNELRKHVDTYTGECSFFHVIQQWWNGKTTDKYYNVRLIRTKCGMRYKAPIHEYIAHFPEYDSRPQPRDPAKEVMRLETFTLYQDRTLDDDKSFKRFFRDREVFAAEYNEDLKMEREHDPRTTFYYGQTHMCLGHVEEAYRLYAHRTTQTGFVEEIFHAFLRCADIAIKLKHDSEEIVSWYLKCYQYSCSIEMPRAEPLYKLAEYYKDICLDLGFMYLKKACELNYPEKAILFVDKRCYDYLRWNLMGTLARKLGYNEVGKYSCIMALRSEFNEDDRKNLALYCSDEEVKNILKNIKEKTLHINPLFASVPADPLCNQPPQVPFEPEQIKKANKDALQNKLESLRLNRKKKTHAKK